MATLDITVPCGVDLGPYTYSFCLMFADSDVVYSSACDTLCNPFYFVEGCCKTYYVRNEGGSLEYLGYYDCCTGNLVNSEIGAFGITEVCSRGAPIWGGPLTVEYLYCCDCFNSPGSDCSP